MPFKMASCFLAPIPGRPTSRPSFAASSSASTLVMSSSFHSVCTSFGPTPFTRVSSMRPTGTSRASSSSCGSLPVVASSVSLRAISLPTPSMSVSGFPAFTMASTGSESSSSAAAALR